jgi:hypothetical protein
VLRGNQLVGSLPDQWSTLTKLGALSLGDNKLTGTVSVGGCHERRAGPLHVGPGAVACISCMAWGCTGGAPCAIGTPSQYARQLSPFHSVLDGQCLV